MPDFQNFEMTYWVWFAAAAVLAIMEIIAPGIFMIWLAMAAAATASVSTSSLLSRAATASMAIRPFTSH